MQYDHRAIESKWRKRWDEEGTYQVKEDGSKEKYYALDMFPYPSGAGLHVGHPLGYIASDIVSRYKRSKGYNVLHPMGYDAFGLPAEQYAIQTGQHPAVTTEKNIDRYREQLDRMGFSFDWSRQVVTSDPNYYKWTQWIFLQLFNSYYDTREDKARPIEELIARFEAEGCLGQDAAVLTGDTEEHIGQFSAEEWAGFDERTKQMVLQHFRLAYLSDAWVNWCPALGTVLANDEVKDGVSERGGHPVERKRMPQWSLRITSYADRLLEGLDRIDWPDAMKEVQRNWIGRSEGASVYFNVGDGRIEVFTTRPDTLFGVTFLTLAPEHELVDILTTDEHREKVQEYVLVAKNRSERERQMDADKVSGVFTGAYAKHPFTQDKIPVWVGDYVLAGYGTGAVMAVPGGDQRDWKFAKHFDLPIFAITEGADIHKEADERKDAIICNSDFLNRLPVPEAIKKAIEKLEAIGAGEGKVNFRLRDAAFGRQRYWGEPIPIYYKDGIPYPMDEADLPLVLPEVDEFLPTAEGEPPLARAADWEYKGFPLETTTMPGWAASSWYYLRYMSPKEDGSFVNEEALKHWGQVDLYVGGAEHGTGHLLYVRFWTKFLFDLGLIHFDEPAKKLVNQGMIQGMSDKIYMRTGQSPNFIQYGNLEYKYLNAGTPRQQFLSGEVYDDFIANGEMASQYVKVNVPNDCVTNGSLDVDAFVNRRPDLKGAIFIGLDSFRIGNGEEFLWREQPTDDWTRLDDVQMVFRTTGVKEVEKMSKSKYNVVNPDVIIDRYGADTLRLYEMFLGPLEQSKPWDTLGIEGTYRFLRRFWGLFFQGDEVELSDEDPTKEEMKILHATLKKVEEDIAKMAFNTCVSQFMIALNELHGLKCNKRAILGPLTVALAPFAPHMCEEIWEVMGNKGSVVDAEWPEFNESYLVEDSFTYPISFNGKVRMQLDISASLDKDAIETLVMEHVEVQERLEGKTPKKVIVVPKRIVNIVV